MCEEKELLIDEENGPLIIEDECKDLQHIMSDFIKDYSSNEKVDVEVWLKGKLDESLPGKKEEEIDIITTEILNTLEVDEQKKVSLSDAISKGRSKEDWFAVEMQTAMSEMSLKEQSNYFVDLEEAVCKANKSLRDTIMTEEGIVSRNPRLDGFIAEQFHAQTFNMNAVASGSPYRAKVLEPKGGYSKNSVDIVIVDANGKTVRRYQSKYCKDVKATEQAFKHGDYRGQRKLVPEGQESEMGQNACSVLEAPDGTTSNPLSKSDAELMRDEAQSGKWKDLNWDSYAGKDLAIGIGRQASYAALQGALIGVGFDIAQKIYNDEEIEANEVVKTAVSSGLDFGVKAAMAGALKVGIEKGVVTVLAKGTPAGTCANIAFVSCENLKIVSKVISGELTDKEATEKIEQTTVSTVAGVFSMAKGAEIGTIIGGFMGPVGAAVGGFIGGTVGYITGSTLGEKGVKRIQKFRNSVKQKAETLASNIKSGLSNLAEKGLYMVASLLPF